MHLCTSSRGPLFIALGGRFPGEVEHAGAVNFHSDSSLDSIGRVFYTNNEIAENTVHPDIQTGEYRKFLESVICQVPELDDGSGTCRN